jgi:hypothetical protein
LHQRFLSALALALVALCAVPDATAQPARGAGMAATRAASHFHDLEIALADALAARDSQALASRVAPGFQYRTPAAADAVDRDAWLRREGGVPVRIRDLGVDEQGELAIVSLLADAPRGTQFIVDVWKGDQLVSRYASRARDATKPPARPSGRD